MNTKPNDFKLGLFIIGGALLLFGALFVFAGSKFFEGKTVEETYVAEGVEGLKVGAPVLLRGVPVGQVTRINFSWNIYKVAEPRYVVVQFEVGNKVSLVPPGEGFAERVQQEVTNGLRARIKSQGLAGATILSLEYVDAPEQYPPLPFPWKPRHIYIPSAPGEFSQIVSSLNDISGNLKQVDFKAIGELVQEDLEAVRQLVVRVDRANVAGVVTNLNALVADLRDVSARLQAFVGSTNELANVNLQKVTADADQLINQITADSEPLLANINQAADRMDRMLENVNDSALNEILNNLRRASRELESAIRQFREYPSGTIFGRQPPRARSVDPPRQ